MTNPAMGAFEKAYAVDPANAATVEGTMNKTLIVFALVIAGAAVTWNMGDPGAMMLAMLGLIAGLVIAIVTIFKPAVAPVTAPIYGLLEGFLLGWVSRLFEGLYEFIVIQAILLTLALFGITLLLYRARVLRATERFVKGVMIATFGVLAVYVVSLVASLFGRPIPLIHESGPVGIAFSLVVVGIATMNLVIDFAIIERNAGTAPKRMEWYGAFALTVTVVWLYIEVLRLLSKVRSR